uniref:Protein-tyrosine-phosphatase n=1 Tax=Strongyloides papillosus TaxID=174720 RepID=A0A0N5BDB0_STREA
MEREETWFVYNHRNKSLPNGTLTCNGVVDSNGTENTWTGQLRWKSPPEPLKNSVTLYGDQNIEYSCPKNKGLKTVEVYVDIDGILQVGTPIKDEIYRNQLRYLFPIEDIDSKTNVLKPCVIYKSTYDTPDIEIFGFADVITTTKNLTLHFVPKPQILKSYKVIVRPPNSVLPNFYSSEDVYVRNINYIYNNTFIESNETKTINGRIDVDGYGIFKFTYICNECGINNTLTIKTKHYFFGPKNDNEILKGELHVYMSKELAMKPNCSLDAYSFAYLEKVSFEDEETTIEQLKNHTKYKHFKIQDNLVIFKNTSNPKGTLTCYYKTPTNYILETYKFMVVYPPDNVTLNEDNDYVLTVNSKNHSEEVEADKIRELERTYRYQKTFIGIVTVILIIICGAIIIAIIYVNRKEIKNSFYVMKLSKNYPNIYKWCDKLNNENWETYCNIIHSTVYDPEIILDIKNNKITEEGQRVDSNIESLFMDTLVYSQKKLDIRIQAHYINTTKSDRIYIISDHPTPQLIPQYWEMIYHENVSVALSFHYRCPGDDATIWQNFWPHCDVSYGNLKIFKEESITQKLKHVTEYVYYVGIDNLPVKKVTIFHVEKYKEHVMPRSTYGIVELYKLVSSIAGKQRVLIDSKYGVDSSAFIYTYFACIIESMLKDKTLYNPMEIIKEVRKCRYGGDIGAVEYGFILKAIVDYFVSENILYDLERYNKFSTNYNDYTSTINLRVSNVTSELRTFMTFINILDKGLVKQLSLGIKTVGRLDITSLKKNCSRWYEIENDKELRLKNRYHDIPCLDKYALYSGEWPIYNTDISTYINANELSYFITKELKRTLIMCQAPTKSTVNGVVDVMFRNDVGILVLLANTSDRNEKWIECFPIEGDQLVFGKYTVVKLKPPVPIDFSIQMSEYYITDGLRTVPFKVLHLSQWPSNGEPINAWEFLSLYRQTIQFVGDRPILIQCPNGVGWTGTFALIIYMIDKIGTNYYFDPLKDLAAIREHRNQAIQTVEQFMIAFTVVRDYYIEYIKDGEFNVYKWYTKYYKNYFERNKNSITWGEKTMDPLSKAGYNYEFEE